MNRRDFFKYMGCFGIFSFFPKSSLARVINSIYDEERLLYFYNIHTGEYLKEVYWFRGNYNEESLKKIFYILRDFRVNEIKPIDVKLLDTIYILRKVLEVENKPINIISGYRSPKTNNLLREKSSGVAKHSLHLEGRAIDINIEGIPLSTLRDAAKSLKAGGVGYYPSSGFVHIDTGRIRYW